MRPAAPGRCLARCSRLATALKSTSLTSVDFPEPDTPVTAHRTPAELDVDVMQVALRSPLHLDVAARPPALPRGGNLACARQELPGERLLDRHHVLGGALGHEIAAVLAGARPEVDQMVGGPHRPFVVLDDDHRVAEVT